jgi:hypothetical protein
MMCAIGEGNHLPLICEEGSGDGEKENDCAGDDASCEM